jgi:hypothetical protein
LRQEQGYYAKLKTMFHEQNNFSVVFLGSSRAESHYDTRYFDEHTGENSYNLGLPGASSAVAFVALKAYLANSHSPKYLIYEVDYQALKKRGSEIYSFNNYFALFSNTVLRQGFNRLDKRMNHFYYNPYYSLPYTGFKNLSTSLHGWLQVPSKSDSLYYKGFVRSVLKPSLTLIPVKKQFCYFNVLQRDYLDSIIICCVKNNIKLTLISSPLFAAGVLDLANKNQLVGQLRNIATINGIAFYDLSNLQFCYDRKFFTDHKHLNYTGTQKFSPFLVDIFNNKIACPALK